MPLPHHIKIVEVGPRDGLQNEAQFIPTNLKIEFIDALAKSGLTTIESTSFVSEKRVPQMADHVTLMKKLPHHHGVNYPVLIPNIQGLETALLCDVKHIAVFTTVSDTFSEKNTHCTVKQSLQRIKDIMHLAKQHHLSVRGYISCAIACPYEGVTKPKRVAELAERLIELGCEEVSLGDTIGVATPLQVQQLIKCVRQSVPVSQLAVHFHDTYGQALANIYAALELDITIIDSSAAGLGGCPYAPGASGNVATEDVLYLLEGLGINTHVDLDAVIKASQPVLQFLKQPTRSKVAAAKIW